MSVNPLEIGGEIEGFPVAGEARLTSLKPEECGI
jgi:hypothetical protein